MKGILRINLLSIYAIGVTGVFLEIGGGFWDISWHILGLVEIFFTVPHAILYAGIGLTLISAALGLLRRFASQANKSEKQILTGLLVALVGGALQVSAGPFDFWWHATYGFDPFLLTPSHTVLITGGTFAVVGMALGSGRLLQVHYLASSEERNLTTPRPLKLLAVVATACLLLQLYLVGWVVTECLAWPTRLRL